MHRMVDEVGVSVEEVLRGLGSGPSSGAASAQKYCLLGSVPRIP